MLKILLMKKIFTTTPCLPPTTPPANITPNYDRHESSDFCLPLTTPCPTLTSPPSQWNAPPPGNVHPIGAHPKSPFRFAAPHPRSQPRPRSRTPKTAGPRPHQQGMVAPTPASGSGHWAKVRADSTPARPPKQGQHYSYKDWAYDPTCGELASTALSPDGSWQLTMLVE